MIDPRAAGCRYPPLYFHTIFLVPNTMSPPPLITVVRVVLFIGYPYSSTGRWIQHAGGSNTVPLPTRWATQRERGTTVLKNRTTQQPLPPASRFRVTANVSTKDFLPIKTYGIKNDQSENCGHGILFAPTLCVYAHMMPEPTRRTHIVRANYTSKHTFIPGTCHSVP